MKRLQAYKFRIEPNGEQQCAMRRIAGTCRFVWNKALALQIANYQQGQKFVNHFDKRADFPTFKKKGASTSFCFPQSCELDAGNRCIRFPKLGWLRYRKSRAVQGTIKNIIVSWVAGKWYANIQTEREVTQPVHSSTSIIGIDLGVTRFVTLSDGTVFEPVNALRKYSDTLAKHQRCLSRKTKFSSNWKKQKQKISRLHHRVAHTRHDFLHKTSTLISKNHAMIVLEDLKVKNMSKSASGTVQAPGRCVKAKSGLQARFGREPHDASQV